MSEAGAITLETVLLQHRVEQFYYAEAAMLDERRFDDWLGLFAPDIRYTMPLRTNRVGREKRFEIGGENDSAYFDEDHASLDMRVRKFKTGTNWAEDPASRTRHLVSNVRIVPGGDTGEGEIAVRSAFLIYRNRLERQTEIFAGERQDILRQTENGLRIARRHILLDQATLLTSSLSFFL